MMLKSKKADYVRLKKLIAQDKILLLVHKKYKGLHKLFIYVLCGLSLRYFDKAYGSGDVILQFGKFGPRVGTPLSWQDELNDYISGKIEISINKTTEILNQHASKSLDRAVDSEIKKFEAKIRDYKDDLFGATLFYEEAKLIWSPSFLKKANFEKHYKNTTHRGETIISKAEKILNEVKVNHNVDKLKEIEFPPLEKDIMPIMYPDNVPRFKLLVETYNELFPGRNRRNPLTEKEHKLIMNKVIDKF